MVLERLGGHAVPGIEVAVAKHGDPGLGDREGGHGGGLDGRHLEWAQVWLADRGRRRGRGHLGECPGREDHRGGQQAWSACSHGSYLCTDACRPEWFLPWGIFRRNSPKSAAYT